MAARMLQVGQQREAVLVEWSRWAAEREALALEGCVTVLVLWRSWRADSEPGRDQVAGRAIRHCCGQPFWWAEEVGVETNL